MSLRCRQKLKWRPFSEFNRHADCKESAGKTTPPFRQRTHVASDVTSSQLASHTIFISVKIALVIAGFVTKRGSAAELFRTFQGVFVLKIRSAVLWAKQKSAVTSNPGSTHPLSGQGIESQILIRQQTYHEGRLCCSRAPQAVLQGAPLDCSNETHCSASWSMAPAGYPTAPVKNVNPSTPLVYPNRRFHKITTPDANTYCGCDSAVTYFPTTSKKGTCSTPTPKCTSDSLFSLQTPHNRTGQQDPGQAHGHKPKGKQQSPSVATVSNALSDTAVQFASEHSTPLP